MKFPLIFMPLLHRYGLAVTMQLKNCHRLGQMESVIVCERGFIYKVAIGSEEQN